MTILLISLLNIIFVIIVYISLSSKMKKMVNNRPEGFDDDINGLIHEFNSVADMNISLLDDRLKTVKIQTDKAERIGQEVEGLIKRFQLLRKDDVKNSKNKTNKKLIETIPEKTIEKRNKKKSEKKQSKSGDNFALQKNLSFYNDSASSNNSPDKKVEDKDLGSESFEELAEKGLSADEIAKKLGVARGEIDLRLRILKLKKL